MEPCLLSLSPPSVTLTLSRLINGWQRPLTELQVTGNAMPLSTARFADMPSLQHSDTKSKLRGHARIQRSLNVHFLSRPTMALFKPKLLRTRADIAVARPMLSIGPIRFASTNSGVNVWQSDGSGSRCVICILKLE